MEQNNHYVHKFSPWVWYVLGEARSLPSECLFPSYWTQRGFVYLSGCLSQSCLWTQESLAEGFRWAQLLFLQDSHKRGCAEAPLSLGIRAEDLLPPLSLELSSANTPGVTPWPAGEPLPGEHLGCSQWGTPFSQSVFNARLSTLWTTECSSLCPYPPWGQHTWLWWFAQTSGAACAGKHQAWK